MCMIALNPASKVTQADMTFVISTSNAFLWTQLGSCVTIICVCLPTLKGVVAKVVPNLFSPRGRCIGNRYDLEELDNSWKRTGEKRVEESASQERNIGIQRTVDVEVTSGVGDEVGVRRDLFVGVNRV
jgi:hypothetical protein